MVRTQRYQSRSIDGTLAKAKMCHHEGFRFQLLLRIRQEGIPARSDHQSTYPRRGLQEDPRSSILALYVRDILQN